MDVLDDDLLRLWRSLNNNQVRYIMIGGFATRFHGFNRNTEDVDIWLDDTTTNRKQLRKAFSDAGYGDMPALETIHFIPGWSSFRVGGSIELDILTEMKGVAGSFDECLQQASVADLEGVKVPFLHINHLIQNKLAVNRPKDQVDVIELQKIKKIREEEN